MSIIYVFCSDFGLNTYIKVCKEKERGNGHILCIIRQDQSLQVLLYSIEDIKWDLSGLSEVRRYGESIEESQNMHDFI